MAATTSQPVRSGYIASPASDWFFLIASPLVAILLLQAVLFFL